MHGRNGVVAALARVGCMGVIGAAMPRVGCMLDGGRTTRALAEVALVVAPVGLVTRGVVVLVVVVAGLAVLEAFLGIAVAAAGLDSMTA